MRTLAISTLSAFLALYIGLECGYRIGHQSALKSNARRLEYAYKVHTLTGTPLYQIITGDKHP